MNIKWQRRNEMPCLYNSPKYYEIAFSFRNISKEVDVFEESFKRFSRIPVKSVLELGCGNSPHMEELVKRGYHYNGLDLNKAMLEYSRKKALRIGVTANLVRANMVDFELRHKFDFVYIMLGSLSVKNTAELISHFNSVAHVLKKGGLYLLDWCIQYASPWENKSGSTWTIERKGVKIKTTVSWKVVSRVEQTFEETIILEVNDHGKKAKITGKDIKRAIYPQEFLCFISNSKIFEFLGWWNNWDLGQPLERAKKVSRPITIIRRK